MSEGERSRNGDGHGALLRLRHRDPRLLSRLRYAHTTADGRRPSQRAVAADVGISPAHLAQIETGAKTPSYRVGTKLAGYYGVEVSALFELVPLGDTPAVEGAA